MSIYIILYIFILYIYIIQYINIYLQTYIYIQVQEGAYRKMRFAEKSKRAIITTFNEESFLWRYGKNFH